ncbi:MAG: energy-coupling factor transporter transmembrane protein EcfT [Roseburia sp.]|nr:energy-coupling factor transporter transmembrane protein EcfT [Anaeroplasma bactoclasticum]MCM1196566.1 energy-coupling factor transporter transmembrane protein EcfT [Roseburia sp.]MCM1557599.1 energy-coupling factor transporter transmembrane protein EcfT [Anaeroplasma bactoclasticum]
MFFKPKKNIYPLFAVLSAFLIMVFGLVMAKTVVCSYFLLGGFVWLLLFGCFKEGLKVLPLFVVVGGIFTLIAYYTSNKNIASALAMANRFGAVFLAIVPCMRIKPVAMTRNLSQLHTPRAITLGMLITMSFVPVLKAEISRVREAMKTRGAGSIFNPKIFYRAFLIPLVTRLVDISDTLALSIETRGFTLGKSKYTVYKKETINIFDIIYILGFIAGIVLVVVL